jgi:hypothetical protein
MFSSFEVESVIIESMHIFIQSISVFLFSHIMDWSNRIPPSYSKLKLRHCDVITIVIYPAETKKNSKIK